MNNANALKIINVNIVHIIPWYVINQKLSKKWFLCKLYPAANIIGGNKKLKNNSVSKCTSSLKI